MAGSRTVCSITYPKVWPFFRGSLLQRCQPKAARKRYKHVDDVKTKRFLLSPILVHLRKPSDDRHFDPSVMICSCKTFLEVSVISLNQIRTRAQPTMRRWHRVNCVRTLRFEADWRCGILHLELVLALLSGIGIPNDTLCENEFLTDTGHGFLSEQLLSLFSFLCHLRAEFSGERPWESLRMGDTSESKTGAEN